MFHDIKLSIQTTITICRVLQC